MVRDGEKTVVWRRKPVRNSRSLRLVLLGIGLAGLAIGICLVPMAFSKDHAMLGRIGVVYVLASLAVLSVRGVLARVHEMKRGQRRDRRRARAGSPYE
jgi:hypothetical protein